MVEEKTFQCTNEGMVAAQAFLERFCDAPKPAVIMDEIVSNIVRCSGASEFSVSLEIADGHLTMIFADDGRAFDPTRDVADPNVHAAVKDRDVGGLGIFMVKKMSKSVDYVRQGDRNVLTVVLPA